MSSLTHTPSLEVAQLKNCYLFSKSLGNSTHLAHQDVAQDLGQENVDGKLE